MTVGAASLRLGLPLCASFGALSFYSGHATAGGAGCGVVRVSLGAAAAQGNGHSQFPALSADGRFVAFQSGANNLVPNDTNSREDIFVVDTSNGAIVRASVDSAGVQGNRESANASLSADGRYVAFESLASNFYAGDIHGLSDIFVHDRQTGSTACLSLTPIGGESNASSYRPAISADGRYVAFHSVASDLVTNDLNSSVDVFVRDRVAGQTSLVSISSAGAQGVGFSTDASISADGRFVAFRSNVATLVPNDTNGAFDVFVRDRTNGTTTRISVGAAGEQGDQSSGEPSISANGRYVAFASEATNLVSNDTNFTSDIFVRDLTAETTIRVSLSTAGGQANGPCADPAISADGRHVAFHSYASTLVAPDNNQEYDVFVRDLQANQTTRASSVPAGAAGNFDSGGPAINANGRYIAFHSSATNLIAGDTNGSYDVFVRDRCPAALLGDLNCDGVVSVGDISGFVLALTDPVAYAIQFPGCDIANADINGDGLLTVGDIAGFVALLV